MVKNKTGGNKAKSFARKNENHFSDSDKLRLPVEDGELFAIVTNVFGASMCSVSTSNGLNLIAHIRKKFTGRAKRNHFIFKNSIILIGLRSWESTHKNCDVLEIYSPSDIAQLKLFPLFPFHDSSDSFDSSFSFSSSSSSFDFTSSSSSSSSSPPFHPLISDSTIFIDDI
jgi:initiation factor 1A